MKHTRILIMVKTNYDFKIRIFYLSKIVKYAKCCTTAFKSESIFNISKISAAYF
jgi:hypothetical protein